MKFNASVLTIAGLSALLTACGGDGTNTGAVPNPQGGTTVAITSSNQSNVARATVNAGFALAQVQSADNDGPAVASTSTLSATRALQHVLRIAANQRKSTASATAHPEAGSTETDPCGVSGTLTSTWNDVDGSGLPSAGDTITLTFAQCQETPTQSVNGALVVTLTGTPTENQFTANAVLQNVAAVYAGVTYTMSGAAALSETDTDTLSSTSFTVGSAGLTVGIASSGYTDSIAFDSGMAVQSSFLAGSSTLTLAGSFTAQSIGGRVTIATPVALVQQSTDTYPSAGQVRITGASGSTLVATALNAVQVQLQLDANGDGTVDSTSTVAWSALIP